MRFTDIPRPTIVGFTEPVTLAQAKAQCRVDSDYTDDDDFITGLIPQARAAIENYCHISLVARAVNCYIEFVRKPIIPWINYTNEDNSPVEFELPYGPVYQFLSMQWFDFSGSYFTMIQGQNFTLKGMLYQKIKIINSYEDAVISYNAGYAPGSVPDDLVLGILNEICFRYESRGDPSNIRATAYTEEGVCQAARVLADKYVRYSWQ